MRDKSYQQTKLGPDVVSYLVWKRLSRASERTLDQYERDLRLVCLATSTRVEGVTHGDLMLVLETVPAGSWKRVRAAWGDFFKLVDPGGPPRRQPGRSPPEAPSDTGARLRPLAPGGARPPRRRYTQDGEPAP